MSEAMTLKLRHTKLSGTPVGLFLEVLYANAEDPERATESVAIHFAVERKYPLLAEARLAVLSRVRDLLSEEVLALQNAEDHGSLPTL